MIQKINLCLITFFAWGLSSLAQTQPNFVIILADDQGWNALSIPSDPDIPASGSAYYRTPNLDRLVKQGTCFSRAYAASPTCGPTRHSIQYGRSPSSLEIFASPKWGKMNFSGKAVESLAVTIKKVCPEYVTAHLGKWHILVEPETLGYDVHDGRTGNKQGQSKDPDDPKKIFDLTKRGNAFMEEQVKAGKPFLLQISHFANHLRYQARAETKKKYETTYAKDATKYQNNPLWAGMNEDLDTGIGMNLAKIKELGIEDNTYVIYTADNGYEGKLCKNAPIEDRVFYKAHPQVSHKYTLNEGGLRVPFIVRGPKIPAGAKSRTRVISYDIFPTILDILGHRGNVPVSVEGGSLWPLLQGGGKKKVSRINPFMVFRYTRDARDICIVRDDFKLLKELSSGKMHLWNLVDDIGEQNNLIEKHPERADAMYKAMTAYFKRVNWDESMSFERKKPQKKNKQRNQ